MRSRWLGGTRWLARLVAVAALGVGAVAAPAARAGDDTTTPALLTLDRLSPEDARPGDPLILAFTALDELGGSGVERFGALYRDPTGGWRSLDLRCRPAVQGWSRPPSGPTGPRAATRCSPCTSGTERGTPAPTSPTEGWRRIRPVRAAPFIGRALQIGP